MTKPMKPAHEMVSRCVIRRDRLEQAEPFAHDVERAVAVEETLPAVAADDGAEPEIAVAYLRVGGDAPARADWGRRLKPRFCMVDR